MIELRLTEGLEQLGAHGRGISLSTGRLHDCADECPDRSDLPATHLLGSIRVRLDRRSNCGIQRTRVRHDLQAARISNLVGRALAVQHSAKHLPGQ